MALLKRINVKIAANAMIMLNLCLVIFHILIIARIIPYNIVWGGRLENVSQMYVFEAASLTINLAITAVIGVKIGYIKPYISEKVLKIILWGLVILFSLNTVGNIVSINSLEAIMFTPITIIAAILCCRLAIEK